MKSSHVKSPSRESGTSRSRKNRMASAPQRSAISRGFTMFPSDFESFCPSNCTQPWPRILRGKGSLALISIAGQITQWNRVMSFPMTWRSAGQYFL